MIVMTLHDKKKSSTHLKSTKSIKAQKTSNKQERQKYQKYKKRSLRISNRKQKTEP